MNSKQLFTLIVVLLIVGGAGALLLKRQHSSWKSGSTVVGGKLIPNLPINDIAQISIKQSTNEVNLAKKDNLWRVQERNDYPANYGEISDFLLKLNDLKVVQTEEVGPSQLPRLELAPGPATNSATVIQFKDTAGKPLQALYLGKKHMGKASGRPSPFGGEDEGFPDGRYVIASTNSGQVAVISEPFANIEPKPENWLNKDFFKIERARTISVTYPAATNSWKISRDTESGEWKLADAKAGEQLDNSKASGVGSALGYPSFNDVFPLSKANEFGMDKPTTIHIETFDNFTYTVTTGAKTNDNYPLTVSVSAELSKNREPGKDEKPDDKTKLDKEFADKRAKFEEKLAQEQKFKNWIYLVSSYTVDPILKDRSALMAEKTEPATNAPASVVSDIVTNLHLPPAANSLNEVSNKVLSVVTNGTAALTNLLPALTNTVGASTNK